MNTKHNDFFADDATSMDSLGPDVSADAEPVAEVKEVESVEFFGANSSDTPIKVGGG